MESLRIEPGVGRPVNKMLSVLLTSGEKAGLSKLCSWNLVCFCSVS